MARANATGNGAPPRASNSTSTKAKGRGSLREMIAEADGYAVVTTLGFATGRSRDGAIGILLFASVESALLHARQNHIRNARIVRFGPEPIDVTDIDFDRLALPVPHSSTRQYCSGNGAKSHQPTTDDRMLAIRRTSDVTASSNGHQTPQIDPKPRRLELVLRDTPAKDRTQAKRREPREADGEGIDSDRLTSMTLAEVFSCLNNVEKAALLFLWAASMKTQAPVVSALDISEGTGFSSRAITTALRNMEQNEVIERARSSERNCFRYMLRIRTDCLAPKARQRNRTRANETDAANDNTTPPRAIPKVRWDGPPETVRELCARFQHHADCYYRYPDGSPTPEPKGYARSAELFCEVCGDLDPTTLRAEHLYAFQDHLLAKKNAGRGGRPYTRKYINRNVDRIRRVLKWAAKPPQRWIPATVVSEAQLCESLKRGRSAAREEDPIRPVAREKIDAILPYCSRHIAAMLEVQWQTGCRPGEVVIMRPCDIARDGDVWLYTPMRHKTAHHGKQRVIALNRRAQEVLQPFLDECDNREAFLFSPQQVCAEARIARHRARRTPLMQGNRPGTNVSDEPKKQPGERYTTSGYRQAIHYACDRAFPHPEIRPRVLPGGRREPFEGFEARLTRVERGELKRWRYEHRFNPNRIRHSFATRIANEHGIDMVKTLCGHSTSLVSEIYAERDVRAAMMKVSSESNGTTNEKVTA